MKKRLALVLWVAGIYGEGSHDPEGNGTQLPNWAQHSGMRSLLFGTPQRGIYFTPRSCDHPRCHYRAAIKIQAGKTQRSTARQRSLVGAG